MLRTIIILIFFLMNLQAELIRSDDYNIVIDKKRGLIWQDDAIHSTTSWENVINPLSLALHKCANKSFAGFSDWRLPNINELKTLIDYTKTDPATSQVFQNFPTSSNGHLDFLSSTTAIPSTKVWYVNFWSGEILTQEKDGSDFVENMYFICVRNR